MGRTLFLHVGPAKTGTSAIQHVLSNHDGGVVLYPRVGLWADGSHHNLVLNYFRDYTRPEVVREDAALLLNRIGEAAARSDRDLVISSEILFGRRKIGDFAAAMQRHLGKSFRIEVIVVVREHFERAASLYNQRVKDAVTNERRDPDDFLDEQAENQCYAKFLRALRRLELDTTVIAFDPAETLAARVLAHLGFAAHQMTSAPRRNVSLSREALVATLAANRAGGSVEDRNAFVTALQKLPGAYAPSGPIFGLEATARAEQIFSADRRFLRRHFGIDLPAPARAPENGAFAIEISEFEQISAVARDFGEFGRAVVNALSAQVRDGRTRAARGPAQ